MAKPTPKTPNLQRVLWWRLMLRKHPGGLMTRADAGRLLGISTQAVCQRVQAGKLTAVRFPGDHERHALVPADEIMAMAEGATVENLQQKPQNTPMSKSVIRDWLANLDRPNVR